MRPDRRRDEETPASLCAVASQARYNDISIRAKQLIDDGTIGPIRFFRVTSPTVGWDVPADGWFVDPKEGGAYLDWGPHGCDTLRWFTGTDATLAFGMLDNFGGIPALDPSAMVSYRLGIGAMAQFWMSYEIPAPGLGSYMQWLSVGEDGMLDFDRDHLRVGPATRGARSSSCRRGTGWSIRWRPAASR